MSCPAFRGFIYLHLLLIIITGVATDYFGPIKYTLAFACPVFAFLFSMSSKFVLNEYSFPSIVTSTFLIMKQPMFQSVSVLL